MDHEKLSISKKEKNIKCPKLSKMHRKNKFEGKKARKGSNGYAWELDQSKNISHPKLFKIWDGNRIEKVNVFSLTFLEIIGIPLIS